MRVSRMALLAGLIGMLSPAALARADTKVELKGVHLCCPACVRAVGTILKDVEGVKASCDQSAKTVTITAADDAAAQKALDALSAGGFHGETASGSVAMKDDSGAKAGKVKSLTLGGVHNCCGACTKAIKDTVKKVDGVTGDTVKPRQTVFTVTGDFDAAELVKALHTAGFHVKVMN